MKTLLRVLAGIAALVALLLLVASFRPSDYIVSRAITIAAPASAVWPWVSQVKKAQEWSPWMDEEPNASVTYSGVDGTVGARSTWDGKKVGAGDQHIALLDVHKRVEIDLHFIKPFEDNAKASYMLAADGAGTRVTWTMAGHNNLIGKVMCMFMSMDKMLGTPFETGLSRLKTKVESAPAVPAALPAAAP